jgi:hypothetical protein
LLLLVGTVYGRTYVSTANWRKGIPEWIASHVTIQMAKMPAIIATIAATPPFATKEVAADVGVDVVEELAADELAELDGPLPLAEPLDAEADAEDDAPLALGELAGVVYETGLGDGVAPVAESFAIGGKRIRSQAFNKIAKNNYQHHILTIVAVE